MARFPARKKIRLSPLVYRQGQVFFITMGTHGRCPWFRRYPLLADAGVQILRTLGGIRQADLYAWCFMPDHVHLLLKDRDIVEFVRLFKGRMFPMAGPVVGEQGLWQRSFYDHALRKEESLKEVARYIWENPVRARIVQKAAEYGWSGSQVWSDWRDFFGRG